MSSPVQKVQDEFHRKGNPSRSVCALRKSPLKFLAINVNKFENNNNTKKKVMTQNADRMFLYKNDISSFFIEIDRQLDKRKIRNHPFFQNGGRTAGGGDTEIQF